MGHLPKYLVRRTALSSLWRQLVARIQADYRAWCWSMAVNWVTASLVSAMICSSAVRLFIAVAVLVFAIWGQRGGQSC